MVVYLVVVQVLLLCSHSGVNLLLVEEWSIVGVWGV